MAVVARMRLAKNLSTDKSILQVLARDEKAKVRFSVSANPNTETEVLLELVNDPDKDVRFFATGALKKRGIKQ